MTVLRVFPMTGRTLRSGQSRTWHKSSLIGMTTVKCWVHLAVLHVVSCEIIVVLWFTAHVSTFVHLFLLEVLVDDLAHEQHVIDAHLCLHSFTHCTFENSDLRHMFLAESADKTAAESVVVARSSTSVKYFIFSCRRVLSACRVFPIVACDDKRRVFLDKLALFVQKR